MKSSNALTEEQFYKEVKSNEQYIDAALKQFVKREKQIVELNIQMIVLFLIFCIIGSISVISGIKGIMDVYTLFLITILSILGIVIILIEVYKKK